MIKVIRNRNPWKFEEEVNEALASGKWKILATNIIKEPDYSLIPSMECAFYHAILGEIDKNDDILISNKLPVEWTEEEKEKFLEVLNECIYKEFE